jgi:hypothetical protein
MMSRLTAGTYSLARTNNCSWGCSLSNSIYICHIPSRNMTDVVLLLSQRTMLNASNYTRLGLQP